MYNNRSMYYYVCPSSPNARWGRRCSWPSSPSKPMRGAAPQMVAPSAAAAATGGARQQKQTPKKLVYLKTKGAYDAHVKNDKTTVVCFTASWCGPCQRLKPHFASLASKCSEEATEFFLVDVDANSAAKREAQVQCMPTFMVFRSGKKIGSIAGPNTERLTSFVLDHCPLRTMSKTKTATTSTSGGRKKETRPSVEQSKTTSTPVGYLSTFDAFRSAISQPLCIVDFTASWCGPCKRMSPVFEQLNASTPPAALFAKVDVDQNPQAKRAVGISMMPTFVVFSEGRIVDKLSGADQTRLVELVRRNVGRAAKQPNNVAVAPMDCDSDSEDEAHVQKMEVVMKKGAHKGSAKQPITKGNKNSYETPITSLEDFERVVGKSTGFSVVSFGAQWSKSCAKIKKDSDKLKGDFAFVNGLSFHSVDISAEDASGSHQKTKDIRERAGVKVLPTYSIWRDGVRLDMVKGAKLGELKKMLLKFARKA